MCLIVLNIFKEKALPMPICPLSVLSYLSLTREILLFPIKGLKLVNPSPQVTFLILPMGEAGVLLKMCARKEIVHRNNRYIEIKNKRDKLFFLMY